MLFCMTVMLYWLIFGDLRVETPARDDGMAYFVESNKPAKMCCKHLVVASESLMVDTVEDGKVAVHVHVHV